MSNLSIFNCKIKMIENGESKLVVGVVSFDKVDLREPIWEGQSQWWGLTQIGTESTWASCTSSTEHTPTHSHQTLCPAFPTPISYFGNFTLPTPACILHIPHFLRTPLLSTCILFEHCQKISCLNRSSHIFQPSINLPIWFDFISLPNRMQRSLMLLSVFLSNLLLLYIHSI